MRIPCCGSTGHCKGVGVFGSKDVHNIGPELIKNTVHPLLKGCVIFFRMEHIFIKAVIRRLKPGSFKKLSPFSVMLFRNRKCNTKSHAAKGIRCFYGIRCFHGIHQPFDPAFLWDPFNAKIRCRLRKYKIAKPQYFHKIIFEFEQGKWNGGTAPPVPLFQFFTVRIRVYICVLKCSDLLLFNTLGRIGPKKDLKGQEHKLKIQKDRIFFYIYKIKF